MKQFTSMLLQKKKKKKTEQQQQPSIDMAMQSPELSLTQETLHHFKSPMQSHLAWYTTVNGLDMHNTLNHSMLNQKLTKLVLATYDTTCSQMFMQIQLLDKSIRWTKPVRKGKKLSLQISLRLLLLPWFFKKIIISGTLIV